MSIMLIGFITIGVLAFTTFTCFGIAACMLSSQLSQAEEQYKSIIGCKLYE